eukprot:954831-Amphidinium_carterae.1
MVGSMTLLVYSDSSLLRSIGHLPKPSSIANRSSWMLHILFAKEEWKTMLKSHHMSEEASRTLKSHALPRHVFTDVYLATDFVLADGVGLGAPDGDMRVDDAVLVPVAGLPD